MIYIIYDIIDDSIWSHSSPFDWPFQSFFCLSVCFQRILTEFPGYGVGVHSWNTHSLNRGQSSLLCFLLSSGGIKQPDHTWPITLKIQPPYHIRYPISPVDLLGGAATLDGGQWCEPVVIAWKMGGMICGFAIAIAMFGWSDGVIRSECCFEHVRFGFGSHITGSHW